MQKPDCDNCSTIHELEFLFETASMMTSNDDLEKKFSSVLRSIKSYLKLQKAAFYALDKTKNELFIYAANDFTLEQKALSKFKLGEGATGLAAKSKEPVVIENIKNDVVFLNKSKSRSKKDISYIAVPVVVGETLIGVISCDLEPNDAIGIDDTVKLLTIVGNILGQAKLFYDSFNEEKSTLVERNKYYQETLNNDSKDIIGSSEAIKETLKIVNIVAPSKATVLIRGETGTGKELIASRIHALSERSSGPFIKLNCAAISETLLESELFGHEKGAFTDAKEMRKGRFELADGGTLFLDEIGDISPSLQVKLLRVLQEQEFERVGGAKTIKVDVRIVAATHKNIESMIQRNEFREDLFYRLNVIPLFIPPLRERKNDLAELIDFFFDKFNKLGRRTVVPSIEAKRIATDYAWPGNVRELENTIERITLLSTDGVISGEQMAKFLPTIVERSVKLTTPYVQHTVAQTQILSLKDSERERIIEALNECDWVITKAAFALGLSYRQIRYKMSNLKIVKP
jgi:Nif-specific regulatory protein